MAQVTRNPARRKQVASPSQLRQREALHGAARLMSRSLKAVFVLSLVLMGCKPRQSQPPATPSPTATLGKLSLSEALPSPTPDPTLPSMPPPVAGAFVFFEDFENGTKRWRFEGGKDGVGWNLLKASTCGGLYTMVLGRVKNLEKPFVPVDTYMTLVTPVQLPKGYRLQLKYDVKGDITPPESARIEPQLRVGSGPWKSLGQTPTARFPTVVSYRVDLTPYAGKAIGLRFRGVTQVTRHPTKGFYLDDIHVLLDSQH